MKLARYMAQVCLLEPEVFFFLSTKYPRSARWNLLLVLWDEKNKPEKGHLELLMIALLLKSRRKAVRVEKGMRTGQEHPHWKDFITNFPLSGTKW